MTFSLEQTLMLAAKLDGSVVKSREQGRNTVSYIESWHAIAEANRIFGFDGWSRETVSMDLRHEGPRKIGEGKAWEKDGWGVTYTAKVRVTVGDVVREGVGAGHGIDADLGQSHESAIKEAESDAAKRALMTFGNQFGLALYDKAQEGVDRGESNAGRAVAARATIAPNGADRQVETMIERVNMATTQDALTATKKHEGFRHDYTRLPANLKKQVEDAIAAKEAELGGAALTGLEGG